MLDYHIHTSLCRHAQGEMAEYVAAARKMGLQEIGFADHFPLALLDYTPRVQVTMDGDELDWYIAEVGRLAQNTEGMAVKLGVEVDYIPGTEEKLGQLLARYPFDYVIGSVHFMDGWDFTHPVYAEDYGNRDLNELYRRYYEMVKQACLSGLFDIIGHIDVIKKFGYYPDEDLRSYYEQTAKVLRSTDTCLELNTAGRDAPAEEFYPSLPFLEICCREGVGITMGSDAHGPDQVGRYFQEGSRMLQDIGWRELTSFSGRSPSYINLGGL